MFDQFDRALANALSSEHAQYGSGERKIATATARRAAAENRVKAMNEATIGQTGFARIHDTASTRFHEDAEAMDHGHPPTHHSVGFYLDTAAAYRKADRQEGKPEEVVSPGRRAHAA